MSLSRGVSKTAWMAVVSSTTPKPAPRWPPVLETALMTAPRTSSARVWSSSSLRDFISAGMFTRSRMDCGAGVCGAALSCGFVSNSFACAMVWQF